MSAGAPTWTCIFCGVESWIAPGEALRKASASHMLNTHYAELKTLGQRTTEPKEA